jgi:hypothetical protein
MARSCVVVSWVCSTGGHGHDTRYRDGARLQLIMHQIVPLCLCTPLTKQITFDRACHSVLIILFLLVSLSGCNPLKFWRSWRSKKQQNACCRAWQHAEGEGEGEGPRNVVRFCRIYSMPTSPYIHGGMFTYCHIPAQSHAQSLFPDSSDTWLPVSRTRTYSSMFCPLFSLISFAKQNI